jgi:hypothetical protein
MKPILRVAILSGCAAAMIAAPAAAAHWGKPGLWALTSTMQMKMAGMPAMTPALMARMKKMGAKFPSMAGQSYDTKMCVTPQDAEKFEAQHYSGADSGCHQTSVTKNGGHIASSVVCDGRMKGQGTSDVMLIDDTHYTTAFTFKGVSHGRPVDMKVNTAAHWLGANCGDVKPFHPRAG